MEPLQTAEDFCRFIWHEYLEERHYSIMGELVDPEISVIGTGAHEVSRSLDEFGAAMSRESTEWNGLFLIKDQWYQTTTLSDTFSLVIGELTAKEESHGDIPYQIRFRFSILLRRAGTTWRILHVHQSVPDPNQARDEFFPHRMVEKSGQEIIYNLRHDTMTGLLNRLYLKATASRYMKDTSCGQMLMLDVDQFKQLNDSFGHPFGDKVLILLAQSLRACFPEAAVGRVGGEEFVVYWSGQKDADELDEALATFLQDWRENQQLLSFGQDITLSIGAAQYPQDGDCYEAVWEKADEALYKAKKSGGDQVGHAPSFGPT